MARDESADVDLLADLTFEQREAVTHFEGPLLILAGPGSGKTRVITRRVAWLLREGVRPSNVLAITFTNKAAGEMRQRVEALVPDSRVWISTFHSLGARLLRQYGDRLGLDRNFTIYDQTDRAKVVKDAIDLAGIDNVRFSPEALSGAISKAKNQLLVPDRYAQQAHDFFGQTVAHVYPVYEKRMRDVNAVDFDDLLLWPALALKNDAEFRAELDARFRFVLIDEYQDTNKAQYAIARALSVDQPNLCVVGDPDQSIYAFRGSDIRNILDFERDFPQARVITLDRNYRSTKAILRAADHVIANNRERKPKTLVTDNDAGRPVTVLTFETGVEEAEGVARRIKAAVEKEKRAFRDFALFLRINALSRTLETAFVKQRVPFQIVKGLAFYERKENRDVLAYLRLLVNNRDDLSFLRVVNEPARGIGKVSLDHLRTYAAPRELSLLAAAAEVEKIPQIKGKATKALREFAKMVHDLAGNLDAPPDEVMRQVLDRSGYRVMLKDSTDPEDAERLANIEELITAAKQFAAEDPARTIADFLENVTLASDVDGWDEKQDCVSVMTLHAAKGLEFPVVYMLAVEQGILPHERSLSRDREIEEERRLAFVGMTRAKEELYLCHARMREFRGQTLYAVPSMFLDELPPEGVERIDLAGRPMSASLGSDFWRSGGSAAASGWADAGVTPRGQDGGAGKDDDYREGMLVQHATYGLGRITGVHGAGAMQTVKIRFQVGGERSFRTNVAKLTIVRRE
ncbi:MAG: UvrD-helicase domain-containing protein [Gemmataceae bacterium]|nr:UvrD-helicase domain-containing protein [Gemmataceae bacterium]